MSWQQTAAQQILMHVASKAPRLCICSGLQHCCCSCFSLGRGRDVVHSGLLPYRCKAKGCLAMATLCFLSLIGSTEAVQAVTSFQAWGAPLQDYQNAPQDGEPDKGTLKTILMCYLQISLIAGMMFVAAGSLHLGFLTNFLSHSVISGFATGSAIIIAVSQASFWFPAPMSTYLSFQLHVLDRASWQAQQG